MNNPIASLPLTSRDNIDILIEAVGGTAIDICRPLISDIGNAAGMEHVSIKFIDTSDSNSELIPENLLHRFPGMAGGGKNRRLIVEKVTPLIPAMVDGTKPAKIYFVVMGAGGASGAGAGPVLIEEHLKRGHNVVVFVVGSAAGSITEIGNTEATLRTMNNYARTYKTPIPMFYRQNDSINTIGMVDEAVRSAIYAFSGLFSNLNHGIEETDMRHFLNYTKVPRAASIAPALVNIDWMINDIEVPNNVQVLSQASLFVDLDRNTAQDQAYDGVFYRTTGEMNSMLIPGLRKLNPETKTVHYLLMRGDVAQRVANLRSTVETMEAAAKQVASNVLELDDEESGGMVY